MRRAARKRRHPMSRPGGKKQFPGGLPVLLITLAGLLAVAVVFALLAVTACAAAPEQTLRLIQDYYHHSIYYGPDVARSKVLERRGDDFKVYLRFHRKKIITVVLNTEHEIPYSPVDATHAHSRSVATRIAEVENHDRPDEREKPIGNDGGYLWRMNTWWRFLGRDGGTYVQCESVSLTRTIPVGLGWLIGPFVNSIPRETLAATLTATRTALTRKPTAGAPAQ